MAEKKKKEEEEGRKRRKKKKRGSKDPPLQVSGDYWDGSGFGGGGEGTRRD
jgi:hypothetical protein